MRRRRGSPCWSAAAAADGRPCSVSCASGSAVPRCSTSTSSGRRPHPSAFSTRSPRCRRSRSSTPRRTVQALADGRPIYVRALADALAALREHGGPGGGDAISALAGLLAPEGRLAKQCEFSYELRLHRARGYGALKAILEILADEEGLTLTEISHRLQRTPGSTKDYLSWLEDVDLVMSRQKRYTFTDPLLRVWVRLHCRASAPSDDDLAREGHRYALPRLPLQTDAPPPQAEPAYAMAGGPAPGSSSGIIEID